MASARIALAAVAVALVGAAPASAIQIDDIQNIQIAAGGPNVQTGKLQPGTKSSCNSPKTVPAVDPGNFQNAGFNYESHINEPTCLTIEYSTTNAACQANGLFSAAYLGNYIPSAIQTNYAGDVGAAPTNSTPVSYSVTLPAGVRLDTSFHMSTPGTGCAGFNLKVSSERPWTYFAPPIAGHPFVGEELRSREEVWEGNPTFTRQWRRCARDGSSCVDIPGASAQTYVPVPDDVGHALRVHVTATDAGFTSTADSDPQVIGIQFDSALEQSLSGTDPTQNGRLAATVPSSDCGTPKAIPSSADVANTRFYDVFRHTNASDGTLCAIVSARPAMTCPNRLLSAAYLPGFEPGSIRQNYLADSGLSAQFGAQTARYSFDVPAGAGYDVVISTFAAGELCPGYDLRFGSASPYPTGAPTVEGTPQADQTLTATDGTWTGSPTSFGYQWQRCFGDGSGCSDIPGATAKTLPLTARNVGDTFRVRVTATQGIGTASKSSALTAAVAAAPPDPPPPPPPDPPAYAGIALKPLTKVVGSKGLVTLSVACPAAAVLGCVGTDAIRLGKATIGLKTFAIGPGKTARHRFTLSKAVRKRLAKRKTLNATQVVNSFDARGVPVRTSAKLTLKARPKPRG